MKQDDAVILFDGVCNLCNWSVRFVLARDSKQQFKFASLQSPAGQRLLKSCGLEEQMLQTLVLVSQRHCYMRSAAALEISRSLRFPWLLLYVFVIIPRPVRDFIYDAIAHRRYRWFGKKEVCAIPEPGVRDRFLDR